MGSVRALIAPGEGEETFAFRLALIFLKERMVDVKGDLLGAVNLAVHLDSVVGKCKSTA